VLSKGIERIDGFCEMEYTLLRISFDKQNITWLNSQGTSEFGRDH